MSIELKLKQKAHRWSRLLGLLPGVRAIFLSGSVTQGRARETSDIDLFIIARPGLIWTARFWVFLVLRLTGQLRQGNPAGKLCPNHFITADHLEIKEKDAYSAHLFSHNQPLYDPHHLYTIFVQSNQAWVQTFGESFNYSSPIRGEVSHSALSSWPRGRGESKCKQPNFLQRWFESCVRLAQLEKIKRNPDRLRPGAKIIMTDHELRFHPRPKNRAWK